MRRMGFTLLEIIVVMGILTAVSGLSIPLYRDYQIRSDLNIATEQVTQGLARARLLSQSGQEQDAWGFYAPAGVLYKGSAYGSRDTLYDETYAMPSTITFTGLPEVSYSKLDGTPSATGSITLTAINDDNRNVLISIEKEAIAVVENDFVTVCHHPGASENPHTLTISENAWPAHQGHGDTLGPCPGDLVASSSSASSEAASSSSSASSAQSSSAGNSCEDRFTVDADGTMTITGDMSVRFDSLGALFTYGDGGPDIPVYVAYRRSANGSWKTLFDGAINGTGGETDTRIGFDVGENVIVRFWANFRQRGWLTYDRKIYSNDGSQSIMVLRNGDTAPTITDGNGQPTVSPLLQSVTVNGVVSISDYDALLVGDFNRQDCNSCSDNYCSNCEDVDYQDGVILVKFLEPSC